MEVDPVYQARGSLQGPVAVCKQAETGKVLVSAAGVFLRISVTAKGLWDGSVSHCTFRGSGAPSLLNQMA